MRHNCARIAAGIACAAHEHPPVHVGEREAVEQRRELALARRLQARAQAAGARRQLAQQPEQARHREQQRRAQQLPLQSFAQHWFIEDAVVDVVDLRAPEEALKDPGARRSTTEARLSVRRRYATSAAVAFDGVADRRIVLCRTTRPPAHSMPPSER